ncbi:hypothetical protein DFH09DRAFT_593317 [Mycena vulgaris]|nr:hypothetical protein DFH09DRAFT_593317 [Mycena vulgaris]
MMFKGRCEELASFLKEVVNAVNQLQEQFKGLKGRIMEVFKSSSVQDKITGYRLRIQELRSNFVLMAGIDTNFVVNEMLLIMKQQGDETLSTFKPLEVAVVQVPQNISSCPPPSKKFQGRQVILEKMHKYFTEDMGKQHIFLLHGLGGAGKTQIALKFIKSSSSLFSDRFFIDTSTLGTIDTGLKSIATVKNAGNTAQDALQWLKNNEKWLLFFDNADDPKDNTDEPKANADDPKLNLNYFLRQCDNGNIIITSRNPGLHVYAEEQSLVSDMEEADAVKLLLRSAAEEITPKSEKFAAAIVKELYYFPLAIIQAGAFISESRDLDSYLTLYSENRAQLLSEKPAQQHDDYAWTVYTTWQMSFEKLSPPAAKFLQLCSLIHHAGISEDIFKNASMYSFPRSGPQENELQMPLDFLSHFLETGAWKSVEFLKMTNEIKRYSLINFDSEKKMFSIHPLVHTWSQSTLTDSELFRKCMVAIVGMSFTIIPNEHRMLAALKLLPHVQLLLKGSTTITPDFLESYRTLYGSAGRWKEAEHLQLEIHGRSRKNHGDAHQSTLNSMAWLAFIYHHLGKLEEAEKLEIVAMEKAITLLGDDHPYTVNAMANLAGTYQSQGKFAEAEELKVVAFEKQRRFLGEDHLDTVNVMANLAVTYHSQGKFAEAEKLEIVVLEKRRCLLGEDHLNTVNAMKNLAATYHSQRKFAAAEKLQAVVFEKRRWLLGEDHLDTVNAIANLAVAYHSQGNFAEAEKLTVVVLEKRRRLLGENHLDTVNAMANLAVIYHSRGKFAEAEKLKVVVLEKRRRLLGEDHLDTVNAMANLGVTYHSQGNFAEAEKLEVVVLEMRRRLQGEDHPDTLITMAWLVSTYHHKGKLQEAANLERIVLAKRREVSGEDHPHTLRAKKNLAFTVARLAELNGDKVICEPDTEEG